MIDEAFPCLVCPDGELPRLTSSCPKCGSVYRRGALVREGKPQPRRRRQAQPQEPEPIDFDTLPWVSFQTGATRDQAVANLWAFYRQYPRKYQRREPEDLYEVYDARVDRDRSGRPVGLWRLHVRRKTGVR